MVWLAIVCALIGCGRIDFVPTDLGTSGGALGCPVTAAIPDPIVISGQTFTYKDFQNTYNLEPTIPVAALDPSGGTIETATSDASSNYSLAIPSGGEPVDVVLTYSAGDAEFLTTTLYVDQPLDHDAPGSPTMTPFQIGDGSMWSDGSMDAVYGSNAMHTSGTISVIVHTCDEELLAGVVVSIDPPPQLLMYSDSNGYPALLGSTTPPYDASVSLNAVTGPTRVTATKLGFVTSSAEIAVGDVGTSTLLLLHMRPEL
jgi:hypothetical protein